MPLDYDAWRFAPPTMQQTVPATQADWIAKRDALVKALANDPYWQKTWEGADSYRTETVDSWPAAYGQVQGYANCDQKNKQCVILLRKGATRETLDHELSHAAGYDHPGNKMDLTGWSMPIAK